MQDREKQRRVGGGGSTGHCTYYKGEGESEKFAVLKVPGQCPLVLLEKIGWQQSKTLGSEEGKMMESEQLGVHSRGQKGSISVEFYVWWATL